MTALGQLQLGTGDVLPAVCVPPGVETNSKIEHTILEREGLVERLFFAEVFHDIKCPLLYISGRMSSQDNEDSL